MIAFRTAPESTTARTAWKSPAILIVPGHEQIRVVAPDGATHLVPLTHEAGVEGGEIASPALLELLEQLRGGKRGRVRHAVLVLPRFQHLFRRFILPPCHANHLASVIRYQIDLHTNLGADEACFDFYPLDDRTENQVAPPRRRATWTRFEQLNAGQEEAASWNFGAEVTSLAAIAPYRELIEKAGLTLAAVTTRSQIYTRCAASEVGLGAETTLLVVRDDCGTEVLLQRQGRMLATAYVEQLPGEELEAEELRAAVRHVRGTLEAEESIEQVRVWGSDAAGDGEVVRRVLAEELPRAKNDSATRANGQAVELEKLLARVAGEPSLAGGLNLLRSTVVTDPTAAPRRRRVRAVLLATLALAGGGWFADSHLRALDQQITALAAEVQATQQQVERGERTGKTHEAIASRWKNRQEWIPALDAVFRPMEGEDAVELATLNADASRGQGESEFVLSGTAPDSTVVPRLLARYAQDKSIVEVSPLGIRPQRNQDGEGVQFDLRVVRKAGPGTRE